MGNVSHKLLTSHGPSAGAADMPLWLLFVLEYCDWDVRLGLTLLSKQWRTNAQTASFFRFLCDRLAKERGIYVPFTLPPRYSWKLLFQHLFTLRDLWLPGETGKVLTAKAHRESTKIQVYAKFRPLAAENEDNDENAFAGVTLPLHQRLAIIKMNRKISNNREALKVLTQEGGWFQAKWQSLENIPQKKSDEAKGSSFYTDMKTKGLPRHMQETASKAASNKIVSKVISHDAMLGRVVMMTPETGLREFNFNSVLPPSTSQKASYDNCVKPLVMDMLNGYNTTALVYGQTGSGKTFTMFGDDPVAGRADDRGIIPRACEEILAAMKQRQEYGIDAVLKVSYVEIFGDQVSDLLRYGERVGQSKVSAQRYVLSGAAEQQVDSMHDIFALLQKGDAQKRRAATKMNERSTRAHSLFILTLHQAKQNTNVTLQSRLFLADLGGSEQVKKSQVEAGRLREGVDNNFSVGFQLGQHMRETVYINLGLLALKKCVEALNKQALYVPYQDSKLTMLLSEGLGGNSKTSIIVCSNLHPSHSPETLATLRFGETCTHIELEARNNANMLKSVIEDLDRQIADLEQEILKKERWVDVERRRTDVLAEEGTWEKASGATEVMKVSVVTGAEKERQQLDALLSQRAALLGSTALLPGETEADAAAATQTNKKVIGFGKEYAELYGIGSKYDAEQEELENGRFKATATLEELPAVLRGRKNVKLGWAVGETKETEEQKKKRVNRNKLAYSGISA